MKVFKRIWPVLFSLIMFAFAALVAWNIYASSSMKAKMNDAEEDLKRQKGMLKQQQVNEENALSEIQYYQNTLDDLQPEYDVYLSKKAQKKALGKVLTTLQNDSLLMDDFDSLQSGENTDGGDEYDYEEVDEDEDEEEYVDENF